MTLVVRRRELTEPGQLQELIIDHVDGIEPGLTVLDSRLLLGQATIDMVGLDAHGVLVLMAVGSVADEEMLLRAVEAYSWSLEYPEAIRRLYPSAHISAAQPPRIVFVVERMPDAFHRKIKQLGFSEVDCVEFRYLDVDGTPAVYFETLARLRRGPVAAAPPVPAPERVAPPTAPAPSGRPTSVKLQKLLGGDRPVAAREPGQVVSIVHRTSPRGESPRASVTAPAPRLEISVASRRIDEPPAAVAAFAPERPVAAVATAEPAALPSSLVEPADALNPSEPIDESVALEVETAPPDTEPESVVPDVTVENVDPEATRDDRVTESTLEPIETATTSIEASTFELEPTPALAIPPATEPSLETEVEPAVSAVPLPPATDETAASMSIDAAMTSPSVLAGPVSEPLAAEPKVSFANVAKELLSFTNPTPPAEPASANHGSSVEELTRATVAELVGTTGETAAAAPVAEERVSAFSAFSKPPGVKRPRTIAPPPPDPQPIAATPKLGAAPKRVPPPVAATTPEAPVAPAAEAPAAETDGTPAAPPQAFAGLKFPNDGVLTRQWMEFLNQMAAGK